MRLKLEWSRQAEDDHEAIVEYIFADNMRATLESGDRIRIAVLNLLDFPELGKEGRISGTRELVLARDRCIAVYRINGDVLEVLRLIHGGQEWPNEI